MSTSTWSFWRRLWAASAPYLGIASERASFDLPGWDPIVKVSLPEGLTAERLLDFKAFVDWQACLKQSLEEQTRGYHPFHSQRFGLRAIEVKSFSTTDKFGEPPVGRILFVTLQAQIVNDRGETLPGHVFLRGGSATVLMILHPIGKPEERYVIMTEQARPAAGSLRFQELPAGMLDKENNVKLAAAREIEEEVNLNIATKDLVNMNEEVLALQQEEPMDEPLRTAMYPSPGACDEFINIFLWEQSMAEVEIQALDGRLTGKVAEQEKIQVRLLKYEQLLQRGARDGKTLAAWSLSTPQQPKAAASVDAEDAHHAGVDYLKATYKFGIHPRERSKDDEVLGNLKVEVFGHVLDNPIGISGGLDKDAEIPDALLALGPGLVEVGGATPRPQEGNPKPRVFRVASQDAIINRYGLNSKGADHMAVQLRERVRQHAFDNGLGYEAASERLIMDGDAGVPPGSLYPGRLLAVQVAKNKTTPDSDIDAVAGDYVYCVNRLAKYADVLVVNVSSPNTPGLRDLQAVAPLTAILTAVVKEAKKADRKRPPPVMVKVSPDEDSDEQVEGICTAVWASGVDGVIVGNTTKTRPAPIPAGFKLPAKDEQTLNEVGGYSGPQLFSKTLSLVKKYRAKLDQGTSQGESAPGTDFAYSSSGSKVIFASGGITNGQQCLEALNAGASLCQIYTAMMYGGVGTVTRIKAEMRDEITKQRQSKV
ncbi:hypothetical protein AMS68_005721 [Peltaster fructicola]|uniref:Dihydroorotate dehydrogenase (quinone), mitochondrial n=1 Tax=Peltaster fructicola TaxID=286661 RepID=A0A6H0XZN1_9PEZI|nr:hypothetical protein AMS68_005721 [Peltaster fructicola]